MFRLKDSGYCIALSILFLFCTAVSCSAQDIDTAPLGFLHWRLIGSFRGGRVTAVAGVPDDPNVYYFGTPGGGIWKTTDAGHVWKPIFDKEHVASIGALAIAPSDSKTIYAGTGEQTPGKGIYKSTDGGDTWTQTGLEDTRFIQAVIVDPHDPNVLIAGANSIGMYVFSRPAPLATFTTLRGVFKSTDGGKTWAQTLKNDETAGVFDLEADPDDPRVLYAAMYVPASGPKAGDSQPAGKQADSLLYRSTDEGSTWTLLRANGLPSKDRDRLGISVAPGTNGKRLYAIVSQGFFRSDDAGTTWTQSTKDPRVTGSAYFSRIFVDTKNPDILYVAQTSLYRSLDGGRTFSAYVGAPSGDDFHVLWIDPKNPNRLFLGVDQGAILSVDGGSTWSSWYNQPTGQFYHVTTDNAFPYRTYAAQQDSGTQSVPSRSDNGQITPQDISSVGGFEFCYIAPDPLNPNWVYSGGWYGTVVRYDRRSGQTATMFEKGDSYRVAQMPPLFFSPHDPHTLYLGTQSVLKTTDQGKTWQAISPDLTEWNKVDESKTNPDKPRPPAIEALAASPVDAGEIWAATTNRLVQLTRDGGLHWTKVTPPGLAAPFEILYVEPSHHDASTAYLTIGSTRQSLPPQVLRTRDFGATWQSIINGLPANEGIRIVREDPVRRGLLFAGTESTVFASFDDGDHWHPLTLNLPASPVTDIAIHGNDLVISTYGRGLWILDDISPLRQLTPELKQAAVHLFKPAPALRVRWDTYQDTPLPIETPTGQNPPDGVAIDYRLSAPVSGDTTVTILDARGNVVRKYTSVSEEPSLPLPNVPEYWFATPTTVAATPGMHRLIWDLRYPAPRTLPASYYGPILQYTEYTLADHAIPHETPRQQPQGPLVAPGVYTVELSSGSKTQRQQITVQLDPRVHASQADLDDQLKLAQRILGGVATSYEEYQSVAALSTAVEEKAKSQPQATEQLKKQIQEVREGTDKTLGMGAINRDLTRLLNSVESGDEHPTEPQVQAVNQVCAALTKVMGQWKLLNGALRTENPLQLPVRAVPAAAGCNP
jgi:photosystem II stability/assembly factor-like uncharacterized protein